MWSLSALHILLSVLSFAGSVLSATALPGYTGPYGAGTVDIEVPVSNPRNITDTTYKSNGQSAFELETVLFTLYYPIGSGTTTTAPKHLWLPGNSTQIAEGIAQNSGVDISPSLIAAGFDAFVGGLTTNAQVDAALLAGSSKFPLLIFSHGDSSLPSWYSTWLGEMASRGYVLAAITHRDGTAPATNVTFVEGKGTNRTVLGFTNTQVDPSLEYADFKFRQDQFREAEIAAVIQTLQAVDNGDGDAVYQNSSRGEGSSLSVWSGRLDFDHLLITGHSFGSNTVIQAITTAPTSEIPATAAITFDPGKDSGPLNTNGTIPIAILDSEEWSAVPEEFYGKTHFDTVKAIAQTSLKATNQAWFATLLGTNHASITDAPLISTAFISFFTNFTSNTTIDPHYAIEQYVTVSDLFLQDLVNGTRQGLLAEKAGNPEFTLLPNSTVQNDPWELHVAPAPGSSGIGNSSSGSGSGHNSTSGSSYGGANASATPSGPSAPQTTGAAAPLVCNALFAVVPLFIGIAVV